MDLKLFSHKSRFKIWLLIIFLVLWLSCSVVDSWKITQKCPHGHYFNDGCVACWCDISTGSTKCEKLPRCAGIHTDNEKCPRGRQFKDNCGNDCTCYESTGAVFCNEKRRCPQEIIRDVVPIKIKTTNGVVEISDNRLLRRGGYEDTPPPSRRDEPPRRGHSTVGTTERSYRREYSERPPHRDYSTSTYPSRSSTTTRRPSVFEGVAVSSTPRPQLRIPGRSRSEELIIEPAIIIRKKGSNKANIVRNPSSATSVHLSSRRRNSGIPGRGSYFLGGKHQGRYPSSYYPEKPTQPSAKSSPLTPLLLYEKQLKAIMDIKKAYAKILGSKVNFNFQIATGQVGNPTVTIQQQQTSQQQQQPQPPAQNNGLLFIQNRADTVSSTTDHPRRFDSNYLNSTILTDIPTSTPSYGVITSQQLKPLLPLNVPFFWQKEQIKNTLKQFSPVPPLQHLVSYVTSSTENYLSQFLNKYKNKNVQISPETTTLSPLPSPTSQPNYNIPSPIPSYPPPTPLPPSPPPMPSYSTISPNLESQTLHDPSLTPIHQIYQNHPLKKLLHTPDSNQMSYNAPPKYNYPSHFNNPYQSPSYHPPQQNYNFVSPKMPDSPPHFPFVSDIIRELAQSDHNAIPTATPRSSPALTALPTFQTPGPPYAEVDVVQPLSFLPPPQPEPATPTRRIFNVGENPHHLRPTVRVNLDKPIYVPPAGNHNQYPPQQHYPPTQHQSHSPPQQHYPPPQHQAHPPPYFFFSPFHQQNRRNYYARPRPPPPPPQLHFARPPPRFNPQPQFFMPKPKQYRLVLKGPMREAAVRVDDVVPNFVQKIAQEFFKKPEIYVPKIRPGKPLTLEKIVLNHKEIVPQEVMFASTTPGSIQPPMTKLRFTPDAQWKMREELAKHGVILNEPVTNPIRDYALNDPNIMEMDAPIASIQTWETHTGMGMGAIQEPVFPTAADSMVSGGSSLTQTQPFQSFQQQQQPTFPFPTSTPFPTTTMMDQQHHQELQRQVLLAQQQQNQHQQQFITSSSGSSNDNDNAFSVDPSDFNDFHRQQLQQNNYPPELNLPGVQEVVVDKYVVHDPNDPAQPIKVYSTTTVQPPTTPTDNNKVDLSSILQTSPHRNGLPMMSTAAPSVLIRHHGAPSTTTLEPPTQAMSPTPTPIFPYQSDNIMVTFINSTPQPQVVTTTISPMIVDMPSYVNDPSPVGNVNIADQIKDFLSDQMDFGARPQMDLFDVLFHSRTGPPEISSTVSTMLMEENEKFDQIASETRSGESHRTSDKQIENGNEDEKDVETDKLANIFSLDYKSKYNRKPPEVIVIKVPPEHSDGPFPKVVEKRKGAEIEIQGGSSRTNNDKNDEDDDANSKSAETDISAQPTTITSTLKSFDSTSEYEDSSTDTSSSKRSRNRNRRRKKKRRKKGKRNRNRSSSNSKEVRGIVRSDNDNNDNSNENDNKSEEHVVNVNTNDKDPVNNGTLPENTDAEKKFNEELDWKSKLMANICELNPSSPLCLTYRSICLLMTSDSDD